VSACVLFIYLMLLHARDQYLWTRASDLLRGSTDKDAASIWSAGQMIPEAIPVALEMFIARENIMRYRRMLEEPHDEAQRHVLERCWRRMKGGWNT
jgi:hypothetical protein